MQRRFLLTSLSRWNSPDNVEANLLNRHWIKFDSETKRLSCISLEKLIDQYYAICFTRSGETMEMWDAYGKGDGLDVGVRLGIDADKLRESVRMFWATHRCVFDQSDGGMSHEEDSFAEMEAKLEASLSKFCMIDHVSYKTIKLLRAERKSKESPFSVACKPINKIGMSKMISKAFEDETRLIFEFSCNLLQGFLPLRFEDSSIIKSYTVNPKASDAQRERAEGLLLECGEIGKLKKSALKLN